LALAASDRDGLNGGMHKSLSLLDRLSRTIRTLDGKALLEVS
jgi:citronellol/citronellal dehydrogenase